MIKNFLITIFLIGFTFAQSKVLIQDKEVSVENNEALIEILGMVCSMCAFGIQEGFSDKEFVDKSRFSNGVVVDLDAPYVRVGLKKESEANPEAIMTVIQDAGYDVSSLFIIQQNQLLEFKVDDIGILQPVFKSYN
tara:strand:+ start:36 stop:443 length:408 start_codon:yes stop_codon:yes gene_type:complete